MPNAIDDLITFDTVDVPQRATPSTDESSSSSTVQSSTAPKLSSKPVDHPKQIRSGPSTMELTYSELEKTIAIASEYRAKGSLHPQHLQLHIAALKEDAEMLTLFETEDDELRTKTAQLAIQARRLRRTLEADLIDAQIAEQNKKKEVPETKASGLKLKPLTLPTFDGKSSNFRVYRNFFEENILHNNDLSDTAKWIRFTESLLGHPKELISEIPQSPETLQIAWKLLLDIYGGEDRPVVELYNKLQNLPVATLNTENLRLTHSKLEGLLLSLQQLGHMAESNHFIRYTYLGKFPVEIVYQVQKRRDTPLSELRVSIGELISARECTDQQRPEQAPQPPETKPRSVVGTSNSPRGGTNPKKSTAAQKTLKCVFCGEEHWNDTCKRYATLEARKQCLVGKCLRCLRMAHVGAACATDKRCFYCDSQDHNRALCPIKLGIAPPPTKTQLTVLPPVEPAIIGNFLTFTTWATSSKSQCLVPVRVVVDTAGGGTIITRALAEKLQLQPTTEFEEYTGLDGTVLTTGSPLDGEFQLLASDSDPISVQAAVVDGTIPDVPAANIEQFRHTHPQYKDLLIPPTGEGQPVDVLIGSDMLVEILKPENIIAINADTLLLPTKFGFLIVGRQRRHTSKVRNSFLFNFSRNPLQYLTDLDLVGLTGLDQAEIDDEEQAIKNFYETVQFLCNRYSISWPWKMHPPLLESNFGLALGRLRSLYRRLQKTPELLQQYHQIILTQLEEGIIEIVKDYNTYGEVVHYLPHHPVIQPGKSTSLRPVYDGSSKSAKHQRSLNDCIRKGTKWSTSLLATLLRFRTQRRVVIADIARAFHQISINEPDRDAARFIWLKDPTKPPTTENLQVYRFTRVAFGIIASPFILHAVIQHHAKQFPDNPVVSTLLQDLYADNLVSALPDNVDLIEYYRQAKQFFDSMSMNLTKWATNDDELRAHIPEADKLEDGVQYVLGIKWVIREDVLAIKQPRTKIESKPTPRTVARDMAIHFDPLGWAAPITISAKIFFRKIWEETKAWDQLVQPERIEEWREIAKNLQEIDKIRLPRRYSTIEQYSKLEIHTFVDASAEAYAVVVYLRFVAENETQLALVAAKARLTPKNKVSIPKLELAAIVLGCKFTQFIKKELQSPDEARSYLWSDSQCALSWVKQNKILPPILEKHVDTIKKCNVSEFFYVPSAMNFADVATRGVSYETLAQMNWHQGPSWLISNETWPAARNQTHTNAPTFLFAQITCKQEIVLENEIQGVVTLKIGDFSSLRDLLRRTAFCFLALKKFSRRNFLQTATDIDTGVALQHWLNWDQKRVYALHNEPDAGKPFNLRNIQVFRDSSGLIRCQTRILNSIASIDTVNPILLVKKSSLTKLIILDIHTRYMHTGTSHTLAVLRKTYWLLQGRREVYQTILQGCYRCKKFKAQPYPNPTPAPLPEFRVNRVQKPFQAIGVDICGPFYTRTTLGRGQPKIKKWVLLFTCAVIRAVHIEVLNEMTTEEIMLAFRRFFARRGVPARIISDNAPQFHVLDRCFKDLWHDLAATTEISAYFAAQRIVWDFVPELSPWMGGMYERLVQSIKLALEKTYAEVILLDRQFETTMFEIEAIINTRPLSYVDREAESPIITPNDFLQVSHASVPIQQPIHATDDIVKKLWKSSQTYLDQFWMHWADHYLLLLRERNDQLPPQRRNAGKEPEKGDIVVMIDNNKKRGSWQIAVVERLIRSTDQKIRAVQIRIPNRSRLIRPISKLAPIQVSIDLPNVQDDQLTADRTAIFLQPPEDAPHSQEDSSQAEANGEERREEEIP